MPHFPSMMVDGHQMACVNAIVALKLHIILYYVWLGLLVESIAKVHVMVMFVNSLE